MGSGAVAVQSFQLGSVSAPSCIVPCWFYIFPVGPADRVFPTFIRFSLPAHPSHEPAQPDEPDVDPVEAYLDSLAITWVRRGNRQTSHWSIHDHPRAVSDCQPRPPPTRSRAHSIRTLVSLWARLRPVQTPSICCHTVFRALLEPFRQGNGTLGSMFVPFRLVANAIVNAD